MGNASSSMVLENLLTNEVYNNTEQIRNSNCGGSGSASNTITVTANGDCEVNLQDIRMINELDYMCELNAAFDAIQQTSLDQAIDTEAQNQIRQEGFNFLQNADMNTRVTNRINNFLNNNTFQSTVENCSAQHNFSNKQEFTCSGTSRINVNDMLLRNASKIDCVLDTNFKSEVENKIKTESSIDAKNSIEQIGLFGSGSCMMLVIALFLIVVIGAGASSKMKNSNK